LTVNDVKIIVGGSAEDDAAAFVEAFERAERGVHVQTQRALSFESWEALASVLTGERIRLLRHVHAHPESSVSALARALGRQYRRVHADVAALVEAGLIEKAPGIVRATADRLQTTIEL
jgi:predicted transcriptional regulator